MLAVLMGGRIAEEVFLQEITTGAGNDIERASGMARRMVCEWGMSDLGPVTFGKKEEAIFLGREFAQHQDFSEATAVEIDKEVRRILDKAYLTAKEIITNNKTALDRIARKLLERETLEGWEVNAILREETGVDYMKMKEYYPEEAGPGEKMTIAPGSGPSTDVPTPVPAPSPQSNQPK
jgi:cell division protease FtsH